MLRYILILLLTLLLILPASAQTGYWTVEPGGLVTAVDTTSDGRYVLAGTSRGGVALYAADSGDVVWSHRGDELDASPVTVVIISRGGAFAASGHEDGNITFFARDGRVLWEAETGGPIRTFAISEVGLVLAAGSDQVYLYSTIGERQWAIRTERDVTSVSMDGTGNYIAVGDAKGGIQLLGRRGNRFWSDFAYDDITAVAVSKDGELVASGSLDDNLVVHKRKGTITYLKVTGSPIMDLAMSRYGEYVVTANSVNVVQLWDLDDERLWMKTMDGPVRDVEIDDEGYYIAAGTEGGQVRLYDRRGEMRWEFETEGSLKSLSLSGSGTCLAVGSGNTLIVFDTAQVPSTPETPTPVTTAPTTSPPTTQAAFEAVMPGIVAVAALAVWRRIGK